MEIRSRGKGKGGVQRRFLTMARSRRIGCEAAREWQWQFGERAIDRAGRFGLIDRVTRERERVREGCARATERAG